MSSWKDKVSGVKVNFVNKVTDQHGELSSFHVVLILVVLISLVLIFKSSITSLLNTIFSQINSQAGEVYKK